MNRFAIIVPMCFIYTSVPVSLEAQTIDSPYLMGIHWYSSNSGDTDVEALTGNRGVWVVDQALLDSVSTVAAPNPWETPWVTSPAVDKAQPYAKPGYMQAITAKGHSAIIRLHPQWSVNVPYPDDPYDNTAFAADCKAAASLMKNVHIWQIGNEANLRDEMRRWNSSTQKYDLAWPEGDLQNAPESYAITYLACRDKIHEVSPLTSPSQQIVLMQPSSPGAADSGRYMSGEDFLARMIAAVPDKSKIDGFALHSYAEPGGANFGADGFMNDLRRQIAIIDQLGLGDRPIFITEFNKHMPNAAEAATGAKFATIAYALLNQWNSGPAALWPDSPHNHAIRGTAWFVYRGGAGWDDYSLAYWKGQQPSTSPALNPWYGFQAACAQDYLSGSANGPVLTPTSLWFEEPFSGLALDQNWPLPNWQSLAPSDTAISVTDGEARITATSSFTLAGIHHSNVAFADFTMVADVRFADNAGVAAGEANMDIRFRQQGSGGPGYSLTLFSSAGNASPGQAALRRTSTWQTYRSQAVTGGITNGDSLRITIIANASNMQVKIQRLPTLTTVLDWTGANAVTDSEFRSGGMGIFTYNLKDTRVQNLQMGGPQLNSNSLISPWPLYE